MYKQVRPSAALASLQALRPAYGRPYRAQSFLLRCVSLLYSPVQGSCKFSSSNSPQSKVQYSTAMAARISAAKVQGFRKGDLVDRRWEDSPIYRSTLLHRLQSQGVSG